MLNVIQVCCQLTSRIRTEPVPSRSCLQAVSKPVWHIPLLCVQWKTPDDGQRNCPKHVEFYSKNKFEKLMHPVGFIIRIFRVMLGLYSRTHRYLVSSSTTLIGSDPKLSLRLHIEKPASNKQKCVVVTIQQCMTEGTAPLNECSSLYVILSNFSTWHRT